jgi:hypothetical protein
MKYLYDIYIYTWMSLFNYVRMYVCTFTYVYMYVCSLHVDVCLYFMYFDFIQAIPSVISM